MICLKLPDNGKIFESFTKIGPDKTILEAISQRENLSLLEGKTAKLLSKKINEYIQNIHYNFSIMSRDSKICFATEKLLYGSDIKAQAANFFTKEKIDAEVLVSDKRAFLNVQKV